MSLLGALAENLRKAEMARMGISHLSKILGTTAVWSLLVAARASKGRDVSPEAFAKIAESIFNVVRSSSP